ncbi:MAG: Uma2 family endonuclease [Candidatus Schekmanbacteria bacterium]|nr:Uma2 family endonuclease [Candidatus Schekmanbacteria bacterium]
MTPASILEAPEVAPPVVELIYEDGIPMESHQARKQMSLLILLTHQLMAARGCEDYFAGGNMFLYFSVEQARRRDYRGPDYFAVLDVDGRRSRKAWVVWEEDGRCPNVIVELLSETTREMDLGVKKRIYETVLRTPEYYCFDGERGELIGWRLMGGTYRAIEPGAAGRLDSEQLGVRLGLWHGEVEREDGVWLRFYDHEGHLLPTPEEAAASLVEAERQRADAAQQRADAEQQRADAERARADRLFARLRALGHDPESGTD